MSPELNSLAMQVTMELKRLGLTPAEAIELLLTVAARGAATEPGIEEHEQIQRYHLMFEEVFAEARACLKGLDIEP
jgi:hypothetical protein